MHCTCGILHRTSFIILTWLPCSAHVASSSIHGPIRMSTQLLEHSRVFLSNSTRCIALTVAMFVTPLIHHQRVCMQNIVHCDCDRGGLTATMMRGTQKEVKVGKAGSKSIERARNRTRPPFQRNIERVRVGWQHRFIEADCKEDAEGSTFAHTLCCYAMQCLA